MAEIHRYQVVWQGFSGAPGYTSFYFRYASPPGSTPAINTALNAWCTGIRSALTPAVTLQPQNDYVVLDEVTGALLDVRTDSVAGTPVAGNTAGNMLSDAGACTTLRTAAVVNGRRLRGRVFIVPISSGVMDVDGTLGSGVPATLNAAFSALITATSAAPYSVYHRPVSHAGGLASPVTAVSTRDKAAHLSSRRD